MYRAGSHEPRPGKPGDDTGRVGRPSPVLRHTVRTILPIWALVSISAWAAEACASGKVRKITGLTFPAAISGQTFCSIARAIAAFSGTERARSVEPVWVRRLSISRRKSTFARGEPWNANVDFRRLMLKR